MASAKAKSATPGATQPVQGAAGQSVKVVKRILTFIGCITCFFLGVHFGGGAILRSQGYGHGGRVGQEINAVGYSDAIQDFVERRLLPSMNETYNTLMEKYEEEASKKSGGNNTDAILRPGEIFVKQAKAEGRKIGPKHPILFVPGFITGGLQLWSGEECLKHRFRESIWGGTSMAQLFLSDRECWMRHVALDPISGMDPVGGEIKVRAQTGFEAADYFVSGYWILGKLIQSLADVGYDPNTMDMMTYDWRLAYPLLEARDGFLTDFRLKVERYVQKTGQKAVLLGHSMGNLVVLFFLRWVTEPTERGGGDGGEDWVERHIESFVNVGGPLLGVPKALSAILSGEMEETAVLGRLGDLLEAYLSSKKRKDLIATWASVWAMLPKGGPAIWEVGADTSLPLPLLQESPTSKMATSIDSSSTCSGTDGGDTCRDPDDDGITTSSETNKLVREFMNNRTEEEGSLDDVLQFILDWGGGAGSKVAASRYTSFKTSGNASDEVHVPTLNQWHNPIATPLPRAPSMSIYCLYGVDVPTERGYAYKKNLAPDSTNFLDPPFLIDSTYADIKNNITNGVQTANGDGSVPLVSLGFMCADAWQNSKRLNPSQMKVVTKEYKHEATFKISDPLARSGPKAGEHCDILGNEELTFDVLNIVTGKGGDLKSRIVSNILEISQKINSHQLGGVDYASNVEPKYPPDPIG